MMTAATASSYGVKTVTEGSSTLTAKQHLASSLMMTTKERRSNLLDGEARDKLMGVRAFG